MRIRNAFIALCLMLLGLSDAYTQPEQLNTENIDQAIKSAQEKVKADPNRPGYHLTPLAGSLGDPNGGIYHNGWYHIFYGHHPFSGEPGPWYWGHARSKDLLKWEHMKTALTPPFELGINEIGSGSTIINDKGVPLAFYSTRKDDSMKFWRATFSADFTEWTHNGPNPILSLDYPGLPRYDVFWRDPFVFKAGGRTFLICCADLFDEPDVVVPIFEAKDIDLTSWEYKGNLFTYPKNKLRNFEVPELRPLGDKWILLLSCDGPVDLAYYFTGDFNLDNLKFTPSAEGPLDYSGHYYAQETILDDEGRLFLMAWIPGWDRLGWPGMREENKKNSSEGWNGCFAIPRQLSLDADGLLIQEPVSSMKQLRTSHYSMDRTELRVINVFPHFEVLKGIRGNQLEINLELGLGTAGYCGLNVLADKQGKGGLFIIWSGNVINVEGVKVPVKEWKPGDFLKLQVFIDKQIVEVFINGGRYCVSRKVKDINIQGDYVAITWLGGHAVLKSLDAYTLKGIN